ncbi:MAG: hypothetical protein K2M55_03185 [Muribaculaceae bacterium]|nr:hypothetical protein [Muribaculaceae bacterium]
MKLGVKYFISKVFNVVLLLIAAMCTFILFTLPSTPTYLELGDGYYIRREFFSKQPDPAILKGVYQKYVPFDEYKNFDNYIVVRKKYEYEKMVNSERENVQDTTSYVKSYPERVGTNYYYIISKSTDEIIGPLDHNNLVIVATDKGIRLF